MYSCDIFAVQNVKLNLGDLYWGLKFNLFNTNEIAENVLLCNNMSNFYELLVEIYSLDDIYLKDDVLLLLEKYICDEYNTYERIALDKWKYCVISDIVNKEITFDEKKIEIEKLYASLNYPEDMDCIVYYMPYDDSTVLCKSMESHENVLCNNILEFLKIKKIVLKKNGCFNMEYGENVE